VALANGVVLVAVYLGVAALAWAIADATMPQPRDFHGFHAAAAGRRWRVAHLSDLHVVGERYGFRIESGRSGPRGNERVKHVLRELNALHAENPLDAILITGDMTDAGRSAEWAEFLDAVALYPSLAERILIVPGNHDLNVVDRARASTCRRAPANGCASFGRCPPWTHCKAGVFGWSIKSRLAWVQLSPTCWSRIARRSLNSPMPDDCSCP